MSDQSTPSPLRKPATLDHLRKPRRIRRTVAFCLEDLPKPDAPKGKPTPQEREAHQLAVAEWEAEVEEATVELVIQSISRSDYDALITRHPASPEQILNAQVKGEGIPNWDPEKFAPALIAASIVEPEGVTLEDAQRIWSEWPQGDALALVEACMTINQGNRLEFYQKKFGKTDG